ncbi:unnamed protein product [Caenorhabditis angaria]|uniref:Uncharacterized protein n=1 Tax=Caenorhabditis angaria TaxID=860376 RepID=A0A9P1IS86_9PELO|nr:unnamed protein product [Caenorhabditis angaria]
MFRFLLIFSLIFVNFTVVAQQHKNSTESPQKVEVVATIQFVCEYDVYWEYMVYVFDVATKKTLKRSQFINFEPKLKNATKKMKRTSKTYGMIFEARAGSEMIMHVLHTCTNDQSGRREVFALPTVPINQTRLLFDWRITFGVKLTDLTTTTPGFSASPTFSPNSSVTTEFSASPKFSPNSSVYTESPALSTFSPTSPS